MGILEKFHLTGKAALVTGGARGIGRSIAIALAEAGANVAIVDFDIAKAQQTVEELRAIGGTHIAIRADVTVPGDVQTMVDNMLAAYGKIDAAFCNAGICINERAENMTLAQWQKVMDVNLTGVFLTATAIGKVMISQQKGSIVNTASMSAHIVNQPQPQCAYNASKAGVVMLTKSLAVEWAPHHVRVNSISPGYIATELTLQAEALKPLIPQWNAMSPVGRMGQPEELQAIAVYLASDASDFTTGSDFLIDGAFTCV